MARYALLAAVLLAVSVSPTRAASDAPVALVLEKSGSITPDVSEFSELTSGTVLSLGGDAKIVFDDYYSCSEVTVVGGKVEFHQKGYKISAGAKASHERVPCKQEVVLKQGGEASTGVLRGAAKLLTRTPRLGTRPSFVLVGNGSESFASARFSENGNEVLAAPMSGRRFEWPAGAAPLDAGRSYELTLVPKMVGEPVKTVRFVAASNKGTQTAPLVLIRAD
jgi:hypothetical protein